MALIDRVSGGLRPLGGTRCLLRPDLVLFFVLVVLKFAVSKKSGTRYKIHTLNGTRPDSTLCARAPALAECSQSVPAARKNAMRPPAMHSLLTNPESFRESARSFQTFPCNSCRFQQSCGGCGDREEARARRPHQRAGAAHSFRLRSPPSGLPARPHSPRDARRSDDAVGGGSSASRSSTVPSAANEAPDACVAAHVPSLTAHIRAHQRSHAHRRCL